MDSRFALCACLCLSGCAMTPEQQQAMGEAMQRVGNNLQQQPQPQRQPWTPQPGNVAQPPQFICADNGLPYPQNQVVCIQQPQ
jgi:flagellar basal body L-ring protein FlgH